jgi:hypothetical protein
MSSWAARLTVGRYAAGRMPRYFFHVRDSTTVHDTEGMELASIEEAKAQARRVAGLFKRGASDAPPVAIVVTDETGATVFTLTIW